jgi:hypothetical protein
MKMSLSRIAMTALLLLACLPAGAVTIVTSSGGSQILNANTFGNVWEFTASGITATVSAYANTGSNGVFAPARVRQYSGGLGICNAGEGVSCSMPAHQMDNGGSIDALLITFNQAVQIQSLGLNMFGTTSSGSSFHDSDLTYFVGTATRASLETLLPTLNTGTGANGILTDLNNGLLGSPLTNSFTGSTVSGTLYRDALLNTGDVNYLLVMPIIGHDNDYFKLLNMVVTPGTTTNEGGVPEPSTYAMLGCGLLVLGYCRRFRKN